MQNSGRILIDSRVNMGGGAKRKLHNNREIFINSSLEMRGDDSSALQCNGWAGAWEEWDAKQ